MLRTFCPDPEFGKVALTALSQSFIFKHVRKHDDQLYVELEGIFDFRVTSAVARQLALLAGNEDYKSWHKGIVFSAGEALTSTDGMPWGCELPGFPLKVTG